MNIAQFSRKDLILKNIDVSEVERVCEIGVLEGDFSEWILDKVKPKSLFLVDTWKHYPSYIDANNASQEEQDERYEKVLKRFCKNEKVTVVKNESVVFLSSQEDESFDLIYIDGDHRFAEVLSDLILSSRKIKVGGYIVVDDVEKTEGNEKQIAWPEVNKAYDIFLQFFHKINVDTTDSMGWSPRPAFEIIACGGNNCVLRRVK